MLRRFLTLVVIACFLLSLPLAAQFSSAVEGTVMDSSKAVVPTVTLTLKNVDTGISSTTVTSGSGYYRFPSLPSANFTLTAAAPGFKTTELETFAVTIGETKTLNITLEVGQQATVVSVSDRPPLVESSEGRVSSVIEKQKIDDLPMVGRNFYSLVVLTPGVTGLPTGGTQAYAQSLVDVFIPEYGVNMNAGGRAEQNRFSLDSSNVTSMVRGGVVNITPNAESIQELRVSVNNFSAENGSGAGASVTAITKSGTNGLHGSASYYYTGNRLQTRNEFTAALPVFRRNEWTGSIGGPVIKNKTFFFASLDLLRSGTANSSLQTVETPEFVNLLSTLRPNAISTGLLKKYPSEVAPTQNFRNVGALLGPVVNCNNIATGPSTAISTPLGLLPCNMNLVGDANFTISPPRSGLQWNTRIDHTLTSKDRLFVSLFRNAVTTVGGPVRAAFRSYTWQHTENGSINWTRTISPTLLNEAGFSVVRAYGWAPCNACDVPTIAVTNLAGFGNGGPTLFVQNNYEWRDSLSWNKGSHSFKAGIDLFKLQSNFDPTRGYQRPGFTFNSTQAIFDFANDDPNRETNIGFNPVTGAAYTPYVAERQQQASWFVQDNWKVKSNLSVTLGVRWDTYGKVAEPTGVTNVQFQSGNDFTSRIADGKTVLVDRIYANPDYNNFGPRASFAWDPSRKGRMSVRGGMGIFYDPAASQLYGGSHFNPPIWAIVTADKTTPPFLPLFGLGKSTTDPYQFPRPANITVGVDSRNGLKSGPAGVTWADPSMRNSYSMNFFFGVQYSLTENGDWAVEANYVGSAGRKLYAKFDVNRVNGDLFDGTLNRLNPSFGSIGYAMAPFTSSYEGGNASVKKRFSHGLSFETAFTFGKAIDYMSGFTSGNVIDIANWKTRRGPADFDVARKLSMNLSYHTPALPGANKFVRAAAGSWQMGVVTILQTGAPLSVSCTNALPGGEECGGAGHRQHRLRL